MNAEMNPETTEQRALYVEDYESLRKVLTYIIERAGYDVTPADNLQDAEGHAQMQRFDVYVSGGNYPLTPGGREVTDVGLDLYDKVRQIHEGPLNFVIVSGDDRLEQKCVEQGIRFFKLHRGLESFTAYLQNPQQ